MSKIIGSAIVITGGGQSCSLCFYNCTVWCNIH